MHDVEHGGPGAGHRRRVASPPVQVRGEQYEQGFALLPVLDLMGGQVVAARAGERECYAPIRSPLADGSVPAVVLAALRRRARADAVYIADLDAIRHGRLQAALIRTLLAAEDGLCAWLDGGFAGLDDGLGTAADLSPPAGAARVLPVLGSETLRAAEDLSRPAAARACVLSLDFGAEGFRGDPDWLVRPSLWPHQVIVMTLARVGVDQGPDLRRLADCVARAGARRVWAAGGVRDASDVAALARLGVAGALVATALHAGRLPA